MRQPPQHFVFSRTPRLRAHAHDAVNATLHLVFAVLTVAPDFGLEPVESVHSNDTFADRKKQPFALAESWCGREDEIDTFMADSGDWKKRLENFEHT